MPPFIPQEEARPAPPYPIVFGTWKVLRRFSIGPWRVLRRFSAGGWQKVAEGHELAARRAYEGHARSLGKGMVCLVRPCGTVEESAGG